MLPAAMPCPSCGRVDRAAVAQNTFRCRALVPITEVAYGLDPSYPPHLGVTGPTYYESSRPCNVEYHELADPRNPDATPDCCDNPLAVGRCAICGLVVCAEHASVRDNRHLCGEHATAYDEDLRQQKLATAIASYRAEIDRHLEEIAAIRDPIARLLVGVTWFYTNFADDQRARSRHASGVLPRTRETIARTMRIEPTELDREVEQRTVEGIARVCSGALVESSPGRLRRALKGIGVNEAPWRSDEIGQWLPRNLNGPGAYPVMLLVRKEGEIRGEKPYRFAGGRTARRLSRAVTGTKRVASYALAKDLGVLEDGRYHSHGRLRPSLVLSADQIAAITSKLRLSVPGRS